MATRFLLPSVALLFIIAGTVPAGRADVRSPASWSGIIINSSCTVQEAFAGVPKCTEKVAGAKLALYDDTTRQVFALDPQEKAVGHLGDSVTVHGKLEANTIHVSSLDLLTSFGLPVGRKAPAFALRDQFGREQTLNSLRGRRGTVLLFFRSADW